MISIKPHHFVDILTALGRGQGDPRPHPYGHDLHRVTGEILADREVVVRLEFGADDICGPCRHNVDGECDDTIDVSFRPEAPESKGAYNLLIDRRWARRLGVEECEELTARELCLRIRDRAGDLGDIYRENPPERTAERLQKLRSGVARFLGSD